MNRRIDSPPGSRAVGRQQPIPARAMDARLRDRMSLQCALVRADTSLT